MWVRVEAYEKAMLAAVVDDEASGTFSLDEFEQLCCDDRFCGVGVPCSFLFGCGRGVCG